MHFRPYGRHVAPDQGRLSLHHWVEQQAECNFRNSCCRVALKSETRHVERSILALKARFWGHWGRRFQSSCTDIFKLCLKFKGKNIGLKGKILPLRAN